MSSNALRSQPQLKIAARRASLTPPGSTLRSSESIHSDNSTIPNTAILPGNLLVYGVGIRMDLGYMAGFMRGQSSD